MEAFLQDQLGDYGDSGCKDISEDSLTMYHYALIDSPEKMLAKKYLDMDETIIRTKLRQICWNCFNFFDRNVSLTSHVEWCHNQAGQIYQLPEEGDVVSYIPKNKACPIPYIFFYDFETLQVKSITYFCSYYNLTLYVGNAEQQVFLRTLRNRSVQTQN